MKTLTHALIEQPDILHLALHGNYDEEINEYSGTASFDKTPALRLLLQIKNPFSAYYAVIAVFIEEEMLVFIQSNKRTMIIPVTNDLDLFNNESLGELLENMVKIRFGCHIGKQDNKFVISNGKFKRAEHKLDDDIKVSNANTICEEYLLTAIFESDKNVQNIRDKILATYKENTGGNVSQYGMYDWNELIKCINIHMDIRIRKDYLSNHYFIQPKNMEYVKNLSKRCTVSVDDFWKYTVQVSFKIKANYSNYNRNDGRNYMKEQIRKIACMFVWVMFNRSI